MGKESRTCFSTWESLGTSGINSSSFRNLTSGIKLSFKFISSFNWLVMSGQSTQFFTVNLVLDNRKELKHSLNVYDFPISSLKRGVLIETIDPAREFWQLLIQKWNKQWKTIERKLIDYLIYAKFMQTLVHSFAYEYLLKSGLYLAFLSFCNIIHYLPLKFFLPQNIADRSYSFFHRSNMCFRA